MNIRNIFSGHGRSRNDYSEVSFQRVIEEVQTVRWATREEIHRMIDNGEFIPYEKGLIDLLFFQRNHRGAHTRRDTTRA